MKKLAIPALLGALSAAAAAQSVSLYGVVDVGLRHVRNGDSSATSLSPNGNNTSRIGLKGVEDLGGGLQASFQLEAGLNPDNGTSSDATRFWNRRTTVSLTGSFGELRIGRDYSVTYLGFEDYDVWSDIGISAVNKFDSSLGTARDTGIRSDNQIAWFSPKMGGFYARAGIAPSEGTPGKKYAAGRVGYAASGLDTSVTYGETTVAPVGGDDKFKTLSAGASYDFGIVKVSGYLTRSKFAQQKVANYYIGAQVPAGPGLIRASYIRSNLSGRSGTTSVDANDASQFALGYLYALSKRTAIYTNVSRVKNEGLSAVAIDKNPVLAPGKNSRAFDLGVRHLF
jgi:predicted porin